MSKSKTKKTNKLDNVINEIEDLKKHLQNHSGLWSTIIVTEIQPGNATTVDFEILEEVDSSVFSFKHKIVHSWLDKENVFFIISEFLVNEDGEECVREKLYTREYDIKKNPQCAKTSAHGKLLFCEISKLVKNIDNPVPPVCDCCGRFVFDIDEDFD